MNDSRFEWVAIAISIFEDATDVDTKEDTDTALLANLRHYCDRNGLSFDPLEARTERYYEEKTQALQ
jgi:hypothetical protein